MSGTPGGDKEPGSGVASPLSASSDRPAGNDQEVSAYSSGTLASDPLPFETKSSVNAKSVKAHRAAAGEPMPAAVRPRRRRTDMNDSSVPALAAFPIVLPRPPTPPMPSPPKVVYGSPVLPTSFRPPLVSSVSSSSSQHCTSEPIGAGGPCSSPSLLYKSISSPPIDAPAAWKLAHNAVVSRGRSPADAADAQAHGSPSLPMNIPADGIMASDALPPGPLPRKKWSPLAAFGATSSTSISTDMPTLPTTGAASIPDLFPVASLNSPADGRGKELPPLPPINEREGSFDESQRSLAPGARPSKHRSGSLALPTSAYLDSGGRRSISDRPLSVASSGATTIKADVTPRQSIAGGSQLGLSFYAGSRPESIVRALEGSPEMSSTGLWATRSRSADDHHRPPPPVIPTNGSAHRQAIKQPAPKIMSTSSSKDGFPPSAGPLHPYDLSPTMLRAQASDTSLSRLASATPPMSPYLRPLASPASQTASLEDSRSEDDMPSKESKASRFISRLTHIARNAGRSSGSSEDVRLGTLCPLAPLHPRLTSV